MQFGRVLVLLSGALSVQAWSLNAPETVVYRRAVDHTPPAELTPGAPAEVRRQPQTPQLLRGPQAVMGPSVTVVRRKRPRRRHSGRPVPIRPRVLKYGEPVTPRWRRRSYGLQEAEQELARASGEPGSRPPRVSDTETPPSLPPGHFRVGSPKMRHSGRELTFQPGRRRVGLPSQPEMVNQHLTPPASSLTTAPAPQEYGSRTEDLESLYASKYGSAAPSRRPVASARIPPIPPVYRNLCRTQPLSVVQQMPAPLKSICLDYRRSRRRVKVISGRSAAGEDGLQEARQAAESRAIRVGTGEVYVDPASRKSTGLSRWGSRRNPRPRERAKSREVFYKPYWPYKRSGRRYY